LFCAGWASLFALSRDPFFLFLLVLVGFGAAVSAVQYARERRG
jgi:hypothetical protein